MEMVTTEKKTLYKKDSKGKIRFLNITAVGSTILQESGLIGGKAVVTTSQCHPKNVGRSNATTAEEQAILEVESKIKQKLDEGYFLTRREAEEELVILPMLAKDYKKEKKKVTFPCFMQRKFDGMRALYINGQLISRKGKVIENMDHIIKDLKEKIPSDVILDGELYLHGESFQENMRLIKKYRKGESEKIKYYVYDRVSSDPFHTRFSSLVGILPAYTHIVLVNTPIAFKEDHILDFHKICIEEGYEGSMIRWGQEGYKINGRSSNLLKYKDFLDIALPIKDIIPNERNPKHGTAVFELKGETFKAGMKFSHNEREEFLKNKSNYIGKTAELRFFEYTDKGLPRFPICYGLRLDR